MNRLRRLGVIAGLSVSLELAGLWPRRGLAWADPPAAQIERSYEVLEVYLSIEAALKLMFPSSRIATETVSLTDEQAARVAALADHPIAERTVTVYKALGQDAVDGYAIVTDEVGKFHDITFMVGVTPQGRVKRVDVLVYRESRGGEVRLRRFLRQFDGKSLRDPIRPNRDVINITGSTLSVRAVSRGVRKALGIVREAYGLKNQ
ncbi:MAG: FMN-binding protein [Candidatus Omnitrophica bacterium]|nr:FMN-binding protein [Candidatus Omnitrophota bacterium]